MAGGELCSSWMRVNDPEIVWEDLAVGNRKQRRSQPVGGDQDCADYLGDVHRLRLVWRHKGEFREVTLCSDLSADGPRPAVDDHAMLLLVRVDELERAQLIKDLNL